MRHLNKALSGVALAAFLVTCTAIEEAAPQDFERRLRAMKPLEAAQTSTNIMRYLSPSMDMTVNDEERGSISESFAKMMAKLHGKKVDQWLEERKPPEEVLIILKLTPKKGEALDKIKLSMLLNFLSKRGGTGDVNDRLFDLLITRLNDFVVAEIVAAGRKSNEMEPVYTNLKTRLIDRWISSQKSPEDVSKILGLTDLSEKEQRASPLFSTFWTFLQANKEKAATEKAATEKAATEKDHLKVSIVQ